MKKFFACFMISFLIVGCSNFNPFPHKTSKKEELKRDLSIIAWLTWMTNPDAFDESPCTQIDPNPNPLYLQSPYYFTFVTNTTVSQNIIIGDSTVDISRTYSGWLNPTTTYSYAVSGNRLCGMNTEMRAIKITTEPHFVLISTNGGNDALSGGFTNAQIQQNLVYLVDKIRARWVNTMIVLMLIHPTQLAGANAAKGAINTAAANYVNSLNNTCVYNPGPDPLAFNKVEGQAADPSQMLDSIHYNQAMSFTIKSRLSAVCGLNL